MKKTKSKRFSTVYSPPSVSAGSTTTDSTTTDQKYSKKEKKFPECSKKQNKFATHWQLFTKHLHCIYDYLRSIYIVLGIISNLEMI